MTPNNKDKSKHMNYFEDAEGVEDIQRILDEHPDWTVQEIVEGKKSDEDVSADNSDVDE